MCASSVVSDSATLWTVAHQAPLPMGSSRPESWSGLPFSRPDPGGWTHWIHVACASCIYRRMLYLLSHQGSPSWTVALKSELCCWLWWRVHCSIITLGLSWQPARKGGAALVTSPPGYGWDSLSQMGSTPRLCSEPWGSQLTLLSSGPGGAEIERCTSTYSDERSVFAHNTSNLLITVAFLRPATLSGVLIELVISPYIKNILKQKIAFFSPRES